MTTTMGFLRNDNQTESKHTNTHIAPQDFKHVLITGATGSGKTASLIMPTLQDRISKNHTVIFFEFKGHEHLKIKRIAWQNNRLNDIIELGKPTGAYFNIMTLLNSRQLNAAIIKMCGGIGKDPYWSTAAAQLAVRVVEIHRKLYNIGNTFVNIFTTDEDIFSLHLAETIQSDYNLLILKEEPSFATLNKIISTPTSLIQFFKSLQKLTGELDNLIKSLYGKFYSHKEYRHSIYYLIAEIHILTDMVNKYNNFTIDADSDDASGNNGVIQILANAIALASATDSINIGQIDIMEKIERKSIIIIDIHAIPSAIYGVFVESLLQKLTERIKHGTPKSVSIFIDEANRILEKGMDVYNDVLRESRTELILAAQNEEQMTLKFGVTEWEALCKNILHKYEVKSNHNIFYNTHQLPPVSPLLFNERILELSEKKYNARDEARSYIENRFILKSQLPKYFTITFFQNNMIKLHILNGSVITAMYIGEKVKKKTESQIEILEQEKDTTYIPIDSVFHFNP